MANKEPQTEHDKAFASMLPGEADNVKVIDMVSELTMKNQMLERQLLAYETAITHKQEYDSYVSDAAHMINVVDSLTRQRHMLLMFAEEFIEWSDMQSNYGLSEVHNIGALRNMAEKAIECCDE